MMPFHQFKKIPTGFFLLFMLVSTIDFRGMMGHGNGW
jgi:hypothetical protein